MFPPVFIKSRILTKAYRFSSRMCNTESRRDCSFELGSTNANYLDLHSPFEFGVLEASRFVSAASSPYLISGSTFGIRFGGSRNFREG